MDRPWYRREPWLLPSLLAFVPLGIALVVSKPLQTMLLALAGVLLLVGAVLLVRRPSDPPSNGSTRRDH